MKIYTKGGDAGQTSLFDGARVSKAHLRVVSYGDLDELNACVGVARTHLGDERLADVDAVLNRVQQDLFALGAVLADPRRDAGAPAKHWASQVAFDDGRAAALEPVIDEWDAELPALSNFGLPGGRPQAAALHVARAVARRAEREVVRLVEGGAGHPVAITYLNRLSDMLFVAARIANHRLGAAEITWRA